MNKENEVRALPGLPVFLVLLVGLGLATWLFVSSVIAAEAPTAPEGYLPIGILVAVLLWALLAAAFSGFFTLQPNEARVLILFGKYKGTVKTAGWRWANPFYSNASPSSPDSNKDKSSIPLKSTALSLSNSRSDARYKISLRARTNMGEVIKVNDRRGNPIEIATVVVWRIADTAKAVFDVDDYRSYVRTQVETSLRHVAAQFGYDHSESGELSEEQTLRGNSEEVAAVLRSDLDKRLAVAGVQIDDARITHLAYAPEIAQSMLRRQQAEAIISARRKIVQGAVGMVEMALAELEKSDAVSLDPERRATMVSNLMVVLVSDKDASPVINAGTLYS